MPTLPTRDTLGVRLPRATPGVVGAPAPTHLAAAGQAFAQGERILQDKIAADDRFRLESAVSRYMVEQDKLLTELSEDQDYETYGERYQERIQTIRGEAYANIRSSRDKQLLDLRLNELESRGGLKVREMARNKKVDYDRATLDTDLSSLRDAALTSADPMGIMEQIGLTVDGAVESQLISAEVGAETKRKLAVDIAVSKIGMIEDPEARLSALDPKKNPMVRYIPADKVEEIRRGAENEAVDVRAVRIADQLEGLNPEEAYAKLRGMGLSSDELKAARAEVDFRLRLKDYSDRKLDETNLKYVNDLIETGDPSQSLEDLLADRPEILDWAKQKGIMPQLRRLQADRLNGLAQQDKDPVYVDKYDDAVSRALLSRTPEERAAAIEEIKGMDLMSRLDSLSTSTQNRLMQATQLAMYGDPKDQVDAATEVQQLKAQGHAVLSMLGTRNEERRQTFNRAYFAEKDRVLANKPPGYKLSYAEREEIIRELTKTAYEGRLFYRDLSAGEILGDPKLDADTLAASREDLRSVLGREPTLTEIAEYLHKNQDLWKD